MHLLPRLLSIRSASWLAFVALAWTHVLAQEVEVPAPEIAPTPEAKSPDAKAVTDSAAAAKPDAAASAVVETATVKVFATLRAPDLTRPWAKQSPRQISGSGVVIEGNRILTNAHMVLYSSQVQVQGNQSGDKISAEVVAIAPGIDLAVLKLEDEEFFKTHPPLVRSSALPSAKDAVFAYGYPVGGTELSITKGIVSRIEYVGYSYDTYGLRVQVDAPLNAGNSGGPVVVGEKMIGITKSGIPTAQNIGYIIPAQEIDEFLRDIADGHYDGKFAMFDSIPTLENPAMRASLKLTPNTEGAVVHEIENPAPDYPLKKWDVITKIGDKPIDDEGKIKIAENVRVGFRYLIPQVAKDGKAPLTIIRHGTEMTIDVPLERHRPKLIPYLNGAYPSYFVYGPVVFTPASEELIMALTIPTSTAQRANAATIIHSLAILNSPLVTRRSERPTPQQDELVVIPGPFLPHKLTKGYNSPTGHVVKTVDGIPIKNLRHLVEVLRDGTSEFVTFEFAAKGAGALVFPRQQMVVATEDILTDNGIRAQGSPELMKIWKDLGPVH
jgi:S1-C subfamily serine protease